MIVDHSVSHRYFSRAGRVQAFSLPSRYLTNTPPFERRAFASYRSRSPFRREYFHLDDLGCGPWDVHVLEVAEEDALRHKAGLRIQYISTSHNEQYKASTHNPLIDDTDRCDDPSDGVKVFHRTLVVVVYGEATVQRNDPIP